MRWLRLRSFYFSASSKVWSVLFMSARFLNCAFCCLLEVNTVFVLMLINMQKLLDTSRNSRRVGLTATMEQNGRRSCDGKTQREANI